MIKTKLFVDSCIDLEPYYLKEHDIGFLPFSFTIGNTEYCSDTTWAGFSEKETEQIVSAGLAKLGRPALGKWLEIISNLIEQYDRFIYLSASQKTTGSIATFNLIAQELSEQFSEKEFYGIDSKTVGSGYSILVGEILDSINNDDAICHITSKIKNIRSYVFVDKAFVYRKTKRGIVTGDIHDSDRLILEVDYNSDGFVKPIGKFTEEKEISAFVCNMSYRCSKFFLSYFSPMKDSKLERAARENIEVKGLTENRCSPNTAIVAGFNVSVAGVLTETDEEIEDEAVPIE